MSPTSPALPLQSKSGGTLDYLVNNSGVGYVTPTLDDDIEDPNGCKVKLKSRTKYEMDVQLTIGQSMAIPHFPPDYYYAISILFPVILSIKQEVWWTYTRSTLITYVLEQIYYFVPVPNNCKQKFRMEEFLLLPTDLSIIYEMHSLSTIV
ncbi:hypothetical protein V1520DRAFT_220763 [Lipomyces starkeyi]|uniref:Uncharacterized protein n=1 Tax=Lipomyces starkeyi NRRL Y-11557 TaxID=675824 RepID=A0A1E3Q434_LIPST|nr:hypothetical protein LIPSTDRAFT_63740 [Lipomyces starkeyi NRRL Y-11557]